LKQLELDSHKLKYYPGYLLKWKNGEIIYPITIQISPSGFCNCSCVFCVYDKVERDKIFLSFSEMRSRIKEMAALGVKSFVFSGEGEPLLNTEISRFFEYSKSNNIDCGLITNGISLTDKLIESIVKNVTWARFSINAGTSECYSRVHEVEHDVFDKVFANLKKLVDRKKKSKSDLVVGAQIILLKENCKTIGNLASKLEKVGIDYLTVKPYLPLFNNKIDYDKYKKNVEKYLDSIDGKIISNNSGFSFNIRFHSFNKLLKRTYLRCLGNPFYCEIKSNGDVVVCGVQINKKKYIYGNLYENSFKEIWESKQRQDVKRYLEEEINIQEECMPNCRLDEVNSFLSDLNDPPDHINFI